MTVHDDENIKMRHDKGIGICNDILSILKEVSFGVYHFEMELLFRTSQLLNGILFNIFKEQNQGRHASRPPE